MQTRVAMLRESPGAWEVQTVELDPPKEREVLVRVVANGICHSDDHFATGDLPPGILPFVGGHEAACVVEEVGPAVHDLQVGDHVVTAFVPSCGRCRWCATGLQAICDNGANVLNGNLLDGTYRMHLDGQDVGQAATLGTFAEYTVIPEWSAIKIPKDVSFEAAALLGCGVPTGWGSSVNAAQVAPGDVVIVMGIGGIGMSAVQGAKHAGASRIIAVDPVAFKRTKALELGATDACGDMDEATELARSLTNGQGADSAIVCVGIVLGEHVSAAFSSIRKAGICVITGVPRMTEQLNVSLVELGMYQKRIQGCIFGLMSPARAVPQLLGMYLEGQLLLDEMITRTYGLDDVNQCFADMHAGVNIRGVMLPHQKGIVAR